MGDSFCSSQSQNLLQSQSNLSLLQWGTGMKTDRAMEETGPDINPYKSMGKVAKPINGERMLFLTDGVGTTGYPLTNDEVGPLPYTSNKNILKMNQSPKCNS